MRKLLPPRRLMSFKLELLRLSRWPRWKSNCRKQRCALSSRGAHEQLAATNAAAAQASAEKEAQRSAAELAETKKQLAILTKEHKEVRTRMNQANVSHDVLNC